MPIIYHDDGTLPPTGEWVFVFGSNLAGRHGAGAALVAAQRFYAVNGEGNGPTGLAYAIPTKDEKLNVLPIAEIAAYVQEFVRYAASDPEASYFVTRVGCGLAGYRDRDIAPLFARSHLDPVCTFSFARPWQPFINAWPRR